MNFRYLLFILLLAATIFADTRCNTSFIDTITIRALDIKARPIEGAQVFVHYQYSGSIGVNGSGTFHTVGPLNTSSAGTVKTTVSNIEQTASRLDCDIDINATTGGVTGTTSAVANAHASTIDVTVNVYPIDIYVRDQQNAPVGNATVTIGSESKKTDKNGYVRFFSAGGELSYLMSYQDGKQAGSITVSDDSTLGITLEAYPVTIDVMDDDGEPLNATLTIQNKTVQLDSDGHFYDSKVFGTEIELDVTYAGVTKSFTIYPAVENTETVVFDFGPPTIGNITKEETDGKVRMRILVSDEGLYPSGVDSSSIIVSYTPESSGDSGQWSNAITYVSQKNIFIADFPEFSQNTIVQFKVEISDKEGNKATRTGKFTTSTPVTATNGTNTQPPASSTEEFPLIYVFGSVLIVVFLAYVFLRLRGKGAGNQ